MANLNSELRDATIEPAGPSFRTLLAGGFAAAHSRQRRRLEELLASPTGQRMHRITPGCSGGHDLDRAEMELSYGAVDVVIIDLDGTLPDLLGMIERLRGSARGSEVFIGVLPSGTDPMDRLYLSSVMDGIVEGPLREGSLHRAITSALFAAELDGGTHGSDAAGATWH